MNPIITVADAVALSLVFSRLIALFMAFPVFNSALVPGNVKVLLVISLAFFIMGLGGIEVDLSRFSWRLYLFLILKEALIGFSLGLLAKIFLAAFSYAAEIISYFMGLTIVNIFDPTYGQISILSKLFIFLFYLLFFISDAYAYMFSSILVSFKQIPLFSLTFDNGVFRYIIELSSQIFVLGFKLAFPFALILFIINVALALVNRLIPQINVFIVGLPLQIFVGLAALAFGASVIVYSGLSFLQLLGEDYIYLIKNIG